MKLKTLALATSIALSAMSVAGTAQAAALATSVLDISNFKIFHDVGGVRGTQLNVSDFAAGGLQISNTADLSTALNGATLTNSISGSGEDLNLAPLRLGSGIPAYADNAYTVGAGFVSPPTSTYSLADQSQFGSPVTGLVVGGVPIDPAGTASHAAYVSLDSQGDGSSTANNGLNSTFVFTLGSGGQLDFTFDARAYLEAFTNPGLSASSAYGLTFTIDNLAGGGANVVTWTPDGASNAGGATAFGLTAETDPFKLTDNISRNAVPFDGLSFRGASAGNAFSGSWSGTTVALLANNAYQLTIRSHSEADAKNVPEPATLALMGLGLLGFGLSRRRRA